MSLQKTLAYQPSFVMRNALSIEHEQKKSLTLGTNTIMIVCTGTGYTRSASYYTHHRWKSHRLGEGRGVGGNNIQGTSLYIQRVRLLDGVGSFEGTYIRSGGLVIIHRTINQLTEQLL